MRSSTWIWFLIAGLVACADTAAPRGDTTVVRSNVPQIKCAGSPVITPASVTLSVGDTVRAEAQPGCTSIGAASWTSSDTRVAAVTSRGTRGATAVAVITAARVGQATITARNLNDPVISVTMAVEVR